MEYRAILTRSGDDELKHWKYIKRVKGKDGKYRYIYNDQKHRMHQIGVTESKRDANGAVHKTQYKQRQGLYDHESTYQLFNGGSSLTVKYEGKLSRAAAKGEKWIFDNLISNKRKVPGQQK